VRRVEEEGLLRAWEEAAAQHPLDRALTLLGAVWPDRGRTELARLSVGTRDGLLLSLRERLFGHEMRATVSCAGCGEALDLPLSTAALRAAPPLEAPAADGAEHEIVAGDTTVRFRLIDSGDLAAILGCADPDVARRELLRRVVLSVRHGGDSVDELPAEVPALLERRLAELDPQADVSLDLTCPSCGVRWQAPFDILVFVWNDVDRWARAFFGAVDTLARVYGWREADVLALSPRRRRVYLDMAVQA
jgi:hypothetical protein